MKLHFVGDLWTSVYKQISAEHNLLDVIFILW